MNLQALTTPTPTHGQTIAALFTEWRELTEAWDAAWRTYEADRTKANEICVEALMDARDGVEDQIVPLRATTAEELAIKITILARHDWSYDDLAASLGEDAEALIGKRVAH